MRWDDVQYFLEVAERGSVGAAARSLQVNHSTVLRHIGELERSLGCRLFERLPSGYVLTAEGREFAHAVADIPERLGDAKRRVAGVDMQLRGQIRVTVPDLVGPQLLAPIIREFHLQHPQVTFDLLVDNTPLRLVQREADVALRGANQPPETLVGRRVGTMRVAAYAARRYIEECEQRGRPVESRWVTYDQSLGHLASARWVSANIPASDVVAHTNNANALIEAVSAGLGVGWLLVLAADAREDLVQLRPPQPEFESALWVLTHPELKRVARVASFARFMAERLNAIPALQ